MHCSCLICMVMITGFHFVRFRVQYMLLVPGEASLSSLDTAYTSLCNLETSKCLLFFLMLKYLSVGLYETSVNDLPLNKVTEIKPLIEN